jgi:hypothetical protein
LTCLMIFVHIVIFPPFSCSFIPLRSKYSLRTPSQTPSVYALLITWEN